MQKRYNLERVMNHDYFADIDWDNIGSHEDWEKKIKPFERYLIKTTKKLQKMEFKNKEDVKECI